MLPASTIENELAYQNQILVLCPMEVELISALRAKLLSAVLEIPDENELRLYHPNYQAFIRQENLLLIYENRHYPKLLLTNFEQMSFNVLNTPMADDLVNEVFRTILNPWLLVDHVRLVPTFASRGILKYLSKLTQAMHIAIILLRTMAKHARRAVTIRNALKELRSQVDHPALYDNHNKFLAYLIDGVISGDDVLFDDPTFIYLKGLYVANHYTYYPNIKLPPNSHDDKSNPRMGFGSFISKLALQNRCDDTSTLNEDTFKIVALLLEYHYIRISRLPDNSETKLQVPTSA